jgi:hypothetical protein
VANVGKETVGVLLRLVSEAFDGWRCVTELQSSDGVIGSCSVRAWGIVNLKGWTCCDSTPMGSSPS